ncbi:unnamed protein product [Ambrosiozyma monospora]|uniref:Transcriptional protein SWT1 n=1 Tax=Ambrosiozyma monospora TaxID=43982 RepID=A0A9W7DGD1_AMBMO|nr:unnamed protein product [Ambrosiozyma monospora]
MSHSSYLPSVHSPFGLDYPSYPSNQNESSAILETKNVDMITKMVLEARKKAPLKKITKKEQVYANVPDNLKTIFLVVDTNFIISHLELLNDLHKLSTKYKQIYQIIIPITVVSELDGLKTSSSRSLAIRARKAIDWCYAFLHNSDPIVKGQKLSERIERDSKADNAILDCCLYFKENNAGHMVVLMSNDKNFCVKALTNELLTISHRPQMTAKLIGDTIVRENSTNIEDRVTRDNLLDDEDMADISSYFTHAMVSDQQVSRPPQSSGNVSNISSCMTLEDPDGHEYIDDDFNLGESASTPPSTTPGTINIPKEISIDQACLEIYTQAESLTKEAVDFVLKSEFGEDYEMVGYDPDNLIDLKDCCKVLKKFSFSAFGEYFPKHNRTMKRLSSYYMQNKLSQAPLSIDELKEFKDFWGDVVACLYKNRDQKLVNALEKILEAWDRTIDRCV